MHPKSHYDKLRSRYQPTSIELVFLLESPPASGKYFYDATGKTTEPLFAGLMRLIGKNPGTKEEGLAAFAEKGLFLVDATYQPVNHIKSDKERNEAILKALPELIRDLKRTLPDQRTPIVLVKANICRLLEAPLKKEGFNVLNDGRVIPFPSSGQQAKFHRTIQKLFSKRKIKLTNSTTTRSKRADEQLTRQIRQMLEPPAAPPRKGKVKPSWLRLTEETNALDYLEKAVVFIRETRRTPTAWKWVILALHGALYGFAVSASRGTDSESVSTPTRKGDRRLMSFPEALKRCQDPRYMLMTTMSKCLKLTPSQKEAVRKLHEVFRNNFIHYQPKLWLIELHGQPNLALDILDIVGFLALDTGNYVHLTPLQASKVRSLVFQAKRLLKQDPLYLKPEQAD